MLDHTRSAIAGLRVSAWSSKVVLMRFIVLEILRFLYFAVLAGNCLLMHIYGEPWGHISRNMVTHRSNPQKDHPCAETRRLSHKAWKSVQRFDLGVGSRKKGKDSQKSHKVVIFRLGEKHVVMIQYWGSKATFVRYAVRLRLIAKRVVDFLLVLIELFFRYERIWIENRRFCRNRVSLAQNFRYGRSSPTNHSFCQKTKMISFILYKMWAEVCFVLSHTRSTINGRTDRNTTAFAVKGAEITSDGIWQ